MTIAAASPAQSVTPKVENTAKEEKPAAAAAADSKQATSDEADAPAKSKLNANAKEFSLSGSAPPFVPPPPPQPAAYLPPQPFAIDPNTGMPIPILQQMPMQPGMYWCVALFRIADSHSFCRYDASRHDESYALRYGLSVPTGSDDAPTTTTTTTTGTTGCEWREQ